MVQFGWLLVPFVVGIADLCFTFEIGGDDWTWPGSTWDDLPLGYGHTGWEHPLDPSPLILPEISAPLEHSVTHNHFHHIVGQAPGGLQVHEGLINGHHYQQLPPGHHHLGHHHPTRDWYCNHAKKAKHIKKWLAKMLFCSLVH